jgi:hypothetical protein
MSSAAATVRSRTPATTRALAAVAVGLLLVFGVLGGLQRLGIAPWPAVTAPASLAHAALMIGGWLGSVIGLERAVALKTRSARLAPLLSLSGGGLLVVGADPMAAALLWAASTAFVVAHGQLWRRQRAAHTAVLGLAALCWWLGNTAWVLRGGAPHDGILAAWLTFLVLTVAAERLEMTRLLQRHPMAQPAFLALVGLLAGLVAWGLVDAPQAALPWGATLVALAAWLATQDIARITIRQPGLPRYMAVALWAGYGWLALGGIAWAATALGWPWRDAALHAIGLGFVLSMVMAHAPVILPAVAGVKLQFGPVFYAPLALLHGSVLVRLLGDRALGALSNAAALLLFALTVAGAALLWRRRHG